jgi:hypothetical protein
MLISGGSIKTNAKVLNLGNITKIAQGNVYSNSKIINKLLEFVEKQF